MVYFVRGIKVGFDVILSRSWQIGKGSFFETSTKDIDATVQLKKLFSRNAQRFLATRRHANGKRGDEPREEKLFH